MPYLIFMKKIVICIDGTWNRSHGEYSRSQYRVTNITRLTDSVMPQDSHANVQITYYQEGIGVHWNKVVRYVEGATGYGTAKKISNAYSFLCRNFEPGDEIFLFGFSRGAYAIRSLSNLIARFGIPTRGYSYTIPKAFYLYRNRNKVKSDAEITAFREKHQYHAARIRLVGLFDTVAGIPKLLKTPWLKKFHSYHDLTLPSCVDNAIHAMALQEERKHFQISLFDPEESLPSERLIQIWFFGAHSDIGGGSDQTGLSNLALWEIVNRALSCGLALDVEYLKFFRGYPHSEVTGSYKGLYKLAGRAVRTIGQTRYGNEVIHNSVITRFRAIER